MVRVENVLSYNIREIFKILNFNILYSQTQLTNRAAWRSWYIKLPKEINNFSCLRVRLGSWKLNIYFVVSLSRFVTLSLLACNDLIDNFKRLSHTKDFCCCLASFPTCLWVLELAVILAVFTFGKFPWPWLHHEWLTLGLILDIADLFPSSRLWLVLYPEIIQFFSIISKWH